MGSGDEDEAGAVQRVRVRHHQRLVGRQRPRTNANQRPRFRLQNELRHLRLRAGRQLASESNRVSFVSELAYVHVYVLMCMCMRMWMCLYIYMHVYVIICMCMCLYVYVYVCTCVCVQACMYMRVCDKDTDGQSPSI